MSAPDVTDVTSLGVRASDGGSIYRPPHEERYCTLGHLDTDEQILAAAKRTVPQLVSQEQARAAAEETGLSAEQRDAVVMMLTAAAATTVLIAPAGAGKSHTMAEFARLWTCFTGRRVIGLTTSTNAARVLEHEGLAESYNIAEFLGKIEGSGELRRPVPLHQDDVLVLDEASQLSTADLAMIGEAARQAGARITATGDTAQLGAVEAGGMFGLLAREVPAAELHEVRRFEARWEREASVRLRDGDMAAVAAYDRHGRIRGADEEAAYDRAASTWLADHLRGKNVLLLAIIDQITATPMDGARSIVSVLHGRLQQLELPDQGHEMTWSQRTPPTAAEVAHELAAGLDGRIQELGERMIAQPQPWLLKHLGMLAPDASPALREEYARRAGIAAGYRDAAGITDPGQAISPEPHRDNPELDVMRLNTMKALEITEDIYRTMTQGELEARILDGERTQATAPPEVSSQLRITAQAEADAWQQSADAEVADDQPGAVNAEALASQLTAEKTRLEALNTTYEGWAGGTRTVREAAAKAKAELGRRRQAQPEESSQTMAGWWRRLDADLDAMDRAISRERQAAMAAGKPWPPEKTAQAENRRPETGAVAEPLQRDRDLRVPDHDLPASGPGPAEPGTEALAPQHKHDARPARLDALQARADEAAQRIAADNAERQARAQYTARIEREAHAEPQAETPDEAEIEM